MDKITPIINIKPDVVYMPPENYEPPELKIVVVPEPVIKFCSHDQIKIYPHHRLIQCSNCGITLDPFDHLLTVGRKEGNQLSSLNYLRNQVKNLQNEEARLKKLVASHKKGLK